MYANNLQGNFHIAKQKMEILEIINVEKYLNGLRSEQLIGFIPAVSSFYNRFYPSQITVA